MEEHWLYEAAVETYLPLLDMAERLARTGIRPRFGVSFTPVLLDQLADRRFKWGFRNYLASLARVAEEERRYRGRRGEIGLTRNQRLWRDYYANAHEYFERLHEDIPGAFRRAADVGSFELITSGATHGYLPLIGLDENVRAQIEIGVRTYWRHFGRAPRGFWLPECGYRPGGHWWPVVAHGRLHDYDRRGLDDFLRDAGIDYFFIDEAQLKMSGPNFGGNSPLRLHRVGGRDGDQRRLLGVYARDFEITRRVWQSEWGYPGEFQYLDFHKKTEVGKFRLWRVTGAQVDLAYKDQYDPARAFAQVRTHANHFASQVRDSLGWHHHATGEQGAVVATFDAELFGHWWFEGIAFLEELARIAAGSEAGFRLDSPGDYFDAHRPSWHVELRESSWGQNNDHTVWASGEAHWVWWDIYEAETAIQHLGHLLNGRQISPEHATIVRQAIRELLLLEASDWIFMISNWSTRDHAERRADAHFNDFRRLLNLAAGMARGEPIDDHERAYAREVIARNSVFPGIDLNILWLGKFEVREAAGDAGQPAQAGTGN